MTKNIVSVCALAIAGLAVGCAAPAEVDEPRGASAAAELAPDPNDAQVSLTPTDDRGIVAVTLSKRYFNDGERDDCGGDYSVDAEVDVGRVTDDSIEIRSVSFRYHANANDEAPDSFMSAYSNGTAGEKIDRSYGHAEGTDILQTFQVNRVFEHTRAADHAAAIIDHRTHIAVDDRFDVCGMTMKIVLQT